MGSSLTHSGNGEEAFTDAQGKEDYDEDLQQEEINPNDCYVRGSGYKDIPGEESNPDKGASTSEYDTYEYSVEMRRRRRMLQNPRSSRNLGAEMLSALTCLWSLELNPLVSLLVHGRPQLTAATS